jgi:phosphoglycerate dehydrogenase-like enzyme
VAGVSADWSPAGVDLVSLTEHIAAEATLAERVAGAEILVAMRERTGFTPSLFDRLADLRLLVTTGMGNAAIDLPAASGHGVTVCGTSGIVTPTSELTWGLIHALARHVVADDATMRAGGWQTRVGVGLTGSAWLLGLGVSACLVATLGLAFGMERSWRSHTPPAEWRARSTARLVDKDELLETSDVVSIHLVLSDRTARG